jgi:aspartate ammonia-lyase
LGITAHPLVCKEYVNKSWGTVTALLPYIGYEQATTVVQEVMKTEKTVMKVLQERGLFTKDELDRILSPEAMSALGYREEIIDKDRGD